MGNDEYEKFIIDTSKIGDNKEAIDFKKATKKDFLERLGEKDKKPFGPGDFVVTLDGPFANICMLVVEKDENGMVKVAPAPNTQAIEMHESKLWHFDDYEAAFKISLIEEQI